MASTDQKVQLFDIGDLFLGGKSCAEMLPVDTAMQPYFTACSTAKKTFLPVQFDA